LSRVGELTENHEQREGRVGALDVVWGERLRGEKLR